jgi:hypothetical protein
VVQQPVVRLHDVPSSLGGGHGSAEAVPLLGEEDGHAAPEGPVELLAPSGGDAEEDHLRDPIRVPFGVGEGQGAAPRAPEYQPSVDAEAPAQSLDVRDEVGGGVARQVGIRRARVGRAPPTAPLVEEHDPVGARVE